MSTVGLRPTPRGILACVAAVLLWIAARVTGLVPARTIALALLLALLVALLLLLLVRPGLRVDRQVLADAVPARSTAPIRMRLQRGPRTAWVPLGVGEVRLDLPPALGGPRSLPLAAVMDHRLPVLRRGVHLLGDSELRVTDVFGLLRLRIRIATTDRVIGLPVLEPLAPAQARLVGIDRRGTGAAGDMGSGDLGVIPRPYTSGDDVRRVHWRASARTGRLMTREEEPSPSVSAVLVLDTRDPGPVDPALAQRLEDRAVDHTASLLLALAARGWDVRVLDADADEITHRQARGEDGRSPVGRSVDALAERTALLDLAGVGFGDAPEASGTRTDHAAGGVGLVVAVGIATEGAPALHGLDLDRFAARAPRRITIQVLPDGGVGAVRRAGWTDVVVPADATLREALAAVDAQETA
jgi:uncharacterized protein (DUF58 family)